MPTHPLRWWNSYYTGHGTPLTPYPDLIGAAWLLGRKERAAGYAPLPHPYWTPTTPAETHCPQCGEWVPLAIADMTPERVAVETERKAA